MSCINDSNNNNTNSYSTNNNNVNRNNANDASKSVVEVNNWKVVCYAK